MNKLLESHKSWLGRLEGDVFNTVIFFHTSIFELDFINLTSLVRNAFLYLLSVVFHCFNYILSTTFFCRGIEPNTVLHEAQFYGITPIGEYNQLVYLMKRKYTFVSINVVFCGISVSVLESINKKACNVAVAAILRQSLESK